MRFRRITAVLFCSLMVVSVLTGCSQTQNSPFVSDDYSSASPSSTVQPSPTGLNFAGAYASLDPKTIMLTINGKDTTWDEFFYNVYDTISQIQAYGYQINALSDVFVDDITYEEYVIENATFLALQYAALNYGAQQLGVTLTEEDKAVVQAVWDEQAASAGGEEAFVSQLQAKYCSKELVMNMIGMQYLLNNCFIAMHGDNGSKLSDEDIADSTAQDGYLMAKHILMLTSKTDDSGVEIPLSDAEKAEVRAEMEGLLKQINSYSGDDFDTYFDGLMHEYSQDQGGLYSFPDGYLFQDGDMVSAFYEATQALEIGQTSDLVESEFGYHIIYRIPLNYDTIPIGISDSSTDSLRLLTAKSMFYAVFDTWVNSLDVVNSEQYNSLDFEKIFAVG